ncbi:hypothetical protein ABFX02_08G154400 [Erythranthe guttata]
MISYYFLGQMVSVKMMICLVFLQTPATAAGKAEGLAAELPRREELVHWGGYGEEKLSTVVISGKLLCHAGAHDKLSGHPYPISGASMAVFCGTSEKKKKSWAVGRTNSYGEFVIDLPSHLHAIPNLEKTCVVKVLHVPKSSPCGRAFTGKNKRIKLKSVGEDARIYTTHNINLIPKPSQEYKRKQESKQNIQYLSRVDGRFRHIKVSRA